jgi:hypothetical protein
MPPAVPSPLRTLVVGFGAYLENPDEFKILNYFFCKNLFLNKVTSQI